MSTYDLLLTGQDAVLGYVRTSRDGVISGESIDKSHVSRAEKTNQDYCGNWAGGSRLFWHGLGGASSGDTVVWYKREAISLFLDDT